MNLLKEYTRQHTEASVDWLESYIKTADEEDLHQFRLSLKKIRAVLNYFDEQQIHEKQIGKYKQQLRHMFREAGFIRETQLMINWLKKTRYRILLKEASLEDKLLLYMQNFIDDGKKSKNRLLQAGEKLITLGKHADHQSILHSSLLLKLKTKNMLFAAQSQGSWHELRKLIKQLLYARHWIDETSQPELLTENGSVYFDELQDAIGNWHDAENIKRWLSDEQFFLHNNSSVKNQFSKCWEKLSIEIREKEKTVTLLLNKKNVVDL